MNTKPSTFDRIMGSVPVLGQIYSLGQAIFGKSQADYQKEQIAGQKEMTDYNYQKQIQMIGDSTYAQKQAFKDNNLNTALMYEGAGAGGSSAIQQGAMPSTPIAPNAVEKGQLAVQAATQLANLDLIKSQAEKNRADANNVTEDTKTKEWNNKVNELFTAEAEKDRRNSQKTEAFWKSHSAQAEGEEKTYNWLAHKLAGSDGDALTKESWIVKQAKAEMGLAITEAEKAKRENNILKAEEVIQKFKAKLIDEGLSPESPWYIKLMADFADKLGINPLKQ